MQTKGKTMAVAKKTAAKKPAAKTAKMSKVEVAMTMDRDTKTTRRFQADEEDAAITTLYVKQSALGNPMPDSIVVTVQVP